MSVYYLLQGRSASLSPAGNIAFQPPVVAIPPPPSPGTGTPISNAAFQVVIQTVTAANNVGCVVSVVASNDYQAGTNTGNWATLTTVTIASGVGPQTTIVNMANITYAAYGAFLPTLTGAGATVTCTMSA